MKEQITVTVNGKQITAESGQALSEIIKGDQPCGGHGKCGKCKVIAKGKLSAPNDDELKHIPAEELAIGVRLACLTFALGDCEITTITKKGTPQIVCNESLPEFKIDPTFSNYGVAIDIGTTTLAAQLYNAEGTLVAETSRLNPQSEWGADVISRIEAALNGKAKHLSLSIRNALNEMICEFSAVIDTNKIDAAVITGNTVMLSLLTEQSLEPFSHAPFTAERLFGEDFSARELSLSALRQNTKIYIPPCISAFVGADITCAILETELCQKTTAMLVDIGTNGEMALWHNEKLTVCSTAAGPAFEGVGISMGMQGAAGAIDKVSIKSGKLNAHIIGEEAPVGICGSGLIDAAACMLDLGILDESGFLEKDPFVLKEAVSLTQKDIRMLQLAKGAICAGMQTLIDHNGISSSEPFSLYIAGGFGSYLNKESAVRIGMFPKEFSKNFRVFGNAALAGAAMLLLHSKMAKIAKSLSKKAHVLDLSTSPAFLEYYTSGMAF